MNAPARLTVYAMVGPMGSGKTTLALQIAKDKVASYFSLDGTIKELNVPIRSFEDYERHITKALEIISVGAIDALKVNTSVVFDFGGGVGHWQWLKHIADSADADIEIYQFDIPLDVRIARVKQRNETMPKDVYHFTMSEEEVVASKTRVEIPPPSERVKIIKVS